MTLKAAPTKKTYLKSSEVARLFNVNHSTVFLWVKKGKLKAKKTLGGQFRFLKSDIEQFLQEKSDKNYEEKRSEKRYKAQFFVVLKLNCQRKTYYNPATVTDISSHGIGLNMESDRGLVQELHNGEISNVTIMSYNNTLFKSKTRGTIKHIHFNNEHSISLGVALN